MDPVKKRIALKTSDSMNNTGPIFNFALLAPLACMLLLFASCDTLNEKTRTNNSFSVDNHFVLQNGTPLEIRSVVYVPGYPGYLPWEIEQSLSLGDELEESIGQDIANIKALGANTIRFWGAPAYCYRALKSAGGLYFIQTIWIDGEAPDLQSSLFKEMTKSYIRSVIDRIYSVYTDNDPPLLLYLLGNELSETSILATDAAHPEINSYQGEQISTTSNISASEAFLAEMADYLKSYEDENYGNIPLVSYANFIYTADIIDTPFLDLRSHNVYPYDIPYRRPGTIVGSATGTLCQGWVEELKLRYPNIPLLISETGLSVSPNAVHAGPPHYGYGGNSEAEQAAGLLERITDINSAILPIAGLCFHEYLDAWWKFGQQDSHSQDPDDVEEWFGLTRFIEADEWYETEYRPSYAAIRQVWQAVQ
jgi:hypothetical protein